MEEKEKRPKNIFEEAAKKGGKKKPIKKKSDKLKKKKKKRVETSDPTFWPEGEISYPDNLKYLTTPVVIDPEIEEMMDKIHTMRRDIEDKIENVYSKSGMTRVEITEYLENPGNFSPEEWEKMLDEKKKLSAKAWEIVGLDEKKKRLKKKKRKKKRTRSKTIGGRKRNWIPMQ